MQKEFKVIGKVTYPQTINAHTTYTIMDTEGSGMILSLDSPKDDEFDYGDAVILTVTKKGEAKADTNEAPTAVDPVTGSVTAGNTTTTAKMDTSADTVKSDATTTVDATTTADTTGTDTQAASTAATETEAK